MLQYPRSTAIPLTATPFDALFILERARRKSVVNKRAIQPAGRRYVCSFDLNRSRQGVAAWWRVVGRDEAQSMEPNPRRSLKGFDRWHSGFN